MILGYPDGTIKFKSRTCKQQKQVERPDAVKHRKGMQQLPKAAAIAMFSALQGLRHAAANLKSWNMIMIVINIIRYECGAIALM
jgi:hypothetical protein